MNNLALRMLNDFCIACPDPEVLPSYNNTQYYHPTRKGEIEHWQINGPTFDDSCLCNYSLIPIKRHVP